MNIEFCPYCGYNEPTCDKVEEDDDPSYQVTCGVCSSSGPLMHNSKEAIEQWNQVADVAFSVAHTRKLAR